MKRAAILAALAMLLVASAGYAPCFYPKARHVDYYQYHISCTHDPCQPRDAYVDWWSLDGWCDTDCDGNTYCEGDTHVDSRTMTDITLSPCDPVCE
jgi:hypothetical protein